MSNALFSLKLAWQEVLTWIYVALQLCLHRSWIESPNLPPKDAQVKAIRSHQHLKTVEYVGYGGCAFASELALFLTWHVPVVNKFIFDPHPSLYVRKPRTRVYSSKYRDKLEIARRHAELLAKQIQIRRGVDVVILWWDALSRFMLQNIYVTEPLRCTSCRLGIILYYTRKSVWYLPRTLGIIIYRNEMVHFAL